MKKIIKILAILLAIFAICQFKTELKYYFFSPAVKDERETVRYGEPFSELLIKVIDRYGRLNCSGVQVDEYTALTAAHCVDEFLERGYVQKGVLDGVRTVEISKVIIPQNFNYGGKRFDYLSSFKDYAIIGFKTKLDLHHKLEIASYPSGQREPFVSIGWPGDKPKKLPDKISGTITDFSNLNHYTIGYAAEYTQPGHSGGPVFVHGKLVGILSFGINSAYNKQLTGIGFLLITPEVKKDIDDWVQRINKERRNQK